MQIKKHELDMCHGPILPQLMKLSLPLMLSGILQLLFNAADIIVVGNFASDNSLAAVGSTSALVNLLTNLFLGLSVGANIVASHYIGAKNENKLSKTVHTSIYLSVVCGIILTVIGVFFAPFFLKITKTPPEVLPLSSLYLRIYFLGMIPMLIYNFGSSLLRAKGDTKRPLYYLAVAGVINVILNLFFVILFKMDVAGVALATIISQFVSAFLVIRCLMREEEAFRLELKKIIPDKKIFKRILRVGIPAGINGVVFSFSTLILQSSVNSLGSVVMAGSAAAASIEGFVWIAMNSISQCALSFTAQNMGRGKYSRIGKITRSSFLAVTVTGLVLGLLACIFGKQLLHLYDPRPEIIPSGLTRLSFVCGTYYLCGLMDSISYIIRGLGYAVMPTIVSIFGSCVLRVIWIYTVFAMPQYQTVATIFVIFPITWIITFFIHMVCYRVIRKKLPKEDLEIE